MYTPTEMFRFLRYGVTASVAALLLACSSTPPPAEAVPPWSGASPTPTDGSPTSAAPTRPAMSPAWGAAPSKSRWVAVPWSELPGFDSDPLHEAWNAWIKSCERPAAAFAALCADVRRLSIGDAQEQRAWLIKHLQPYRIEAADGNPEGLLTAYYEPLLPASRLPGYGFSVPLYRLPAQMDRKPWYSRQQIETLPQAQAQLAGREIAWLRDPVDAMVLHIQGSGRLQITEPDGRQRLVRVAFAGTNDHPYQSIGRWLLDQGATRDATWPGIKAWIGANPQRVNELLWSNPRYVFFKEEALDHLEAAFGPRGAQGVALTPGRSIAVDRHSIPYGTPVWLASNGPSAQLNRLVLAQDTGSAIVGAVRADYFTGWGPHAGDVAGRLKQGLRLWALWPK